MASKRLTADLISNFYRPQMKFGRGNVFTPVTLFTEGRSLPMEGLPPGGGGSAPRGWGVCTQGEGGSAFGKGSASGEGVCIQGEGDLHPGRGGSASRQGGLVDPPLGTRKAGGTHPTGMLPCFNICIHMTATSNANFSLELTPT